MTQTIQERRVVIVDRDGTPIGATTRAEAEQQGLARHVSQVFLLRRTEQALELLQQRRAANVSYPNAWHDTASGHRDEDDADPEIAALRELEEEMGITGVPLRAEGGYYSEDMTSTGQVRRRYTSVFSGLFEGTPNPDPAEVADYRWVQLQTLLEEMKREPAKFSPNFLRGITYFITHRGL
jgi:isopentenyl-diphosphate delta-isomerase